jgi:hypothetical protein
MLLTPESCARKFFDEMVKNKSGVICHLKNRHQTAIKTGKRKGNANLKMKPGNVGMGILFWSAMDFTIKFGPLPM